MSLVQVQQGEPLFCLSALDLSTSSTTFSNKNPHHSAFAPVLAGVHKPSGIFFVAFFKLLILLALFFACFFASLNESRALPGFSPVPLTQSTPLSTEMVDNLRHPRRHKAFGGCA
ncbi:hypothetical protein PU634_09080 [Oceanimonas pelagia]|uniref:Uncharacterized protein n=1 Tax=Oceanimonas pelagia TaxID=3028314 RepID=A0AA50KLM0_9GAMM|nr:hypothetical protein [Oceanimonas pelagia]WMC09282.1 hypothetical protein PU634_09080 [Oceanimonas pelagia]